MYSEITYGKIRAWFTAKKYRYTLLKFVYKYLSFLVVIGYFLLLAYLFFSRDARLLQSVTVPLGVFVTVTLIRKYINAQRPYEKINIEPLMHKNAKGKSFPSRHTASSAVIAMVFIFICPPLGAFYMLITILIALSRVFGGVHFPSDVIAAFIYAVAMSCLFLYVL